MGIFGIWCSQMYSIRFLHVCTKCLMYYAPILVPLHYVDRWIGFIWGVCQVSFKFFELSTNQGDPSPKEKKKVRICPLHKAFLHLVSQRPKWSIKGNGTHFKIDNIQFGYIQEHSKFFMTSLQTQINFYNPSMTRINIYSNIKL